MSRRIVRPGPGPGAAGAAGDGTQAGPGSDIIMMIVMEIRGRRQCGRALPGGHWHELTRPGGLITGRRAP